MLRNSSSARSHLQLSNWSNPLIQSITERQQLARPMVTHDISSRTIDLEQNRHRNYSRPLRNTSGRSLIQNSEIAKRRHTAHAHGRNRIQEQNVANTLPRIEINNEPSIGITGTDQIENSDQPNVSIEERLACEITMSYASIPTITTEKSNREEIIVIQHHSTSEVSLVYRGYLTKGETFSFKSQRRSTSNLSLAFYVQGSINYTITECCEFKCLENNSNPNNQKQFLFKEIHKANPCQKCRKDYANNLLLDNQQNTLLVRRSNKSSHFHSNNILKTSPADNPPEGKGATKKVEKTKSTDIVQSQHTETTQLNSMPNTKSPTIPSTEQKTTTTSQSKPKSSYNMETSMSTVSGKDVELFIQKLAAQYQHNQLQRMLRHPKSVENFCYILETRLSISIDEQQMLRDLINLGYTFNDINSKECIDFLKKIINERIILIITKESMKQLSKDIANEPLLAAIYVIDSSEKCSFDSKFYRGSFSDMNSLSKQLKIDLELFTNDLTTICSIRGNYAGMSTLNYVQALKEILLENDETRDLKKEMIDFCREEYTDNNIQLKFIDEFEKDFQASNAIDWYLRQETFVYKMITRAFRVLDPDILFKLRYFIQHLHTQLNSYITINPLTVYRSLRIRKNLFDKMKENKGSLLSFNEFLRVNKQQSTIEPSPVNTASKLVRFEIILGNGIVRYDIPTKPNEILLTMGTIFLIENLEEIDEETFNVRLITNVDILQAGQLLTNSLREAVRGPFPLVRMLKLMIQKELTSYLEYFSSMLLDDPHALSNEPANLTLGGALHNLGSSYYEKKQYDQALVHFQNALKIYLRVLPDNDVRLTPTYNNIGSIYLRQGLHEQALEYQRKAYEIQKNSSNPDVKSIATYLGNIASVLMKLGRYSEAITYLKVELQIQQKLHPNNNHASLAGSYFNVATVQHRLQQYSEALINYQKCLAIELNCHSNKNPTVAVTYYNMATTLEELGQYKQAKEAMENAITRLLLTKEENDEEVQKHRRYLQRLENKLFMENLFAST